MSGANEPIFWIDKERVPEVLIHNPIIDTNSEDAFVVLWDVYFHTILRGQDPVQDMNLRKSARGEYAFDLEGNSRLSDAGFREGAIENIQDIARREGYEPHQIRDIEGIMQQHVDTIIPQLPPIPILAKQFLIHRIGELKDPLQKKLEHVVTALRKLEIISSIDLEYTLEFGPPNPTVMRRYA